MEQKKEYNLYFKKTLKLTYEGFFLQRFLRITMVEGKKEKVEIFFIKILSLLKKNMIFFNKRESHPFLFFFSIFLKSKPLLDIKKIKIGVVNYFIPIPLNKNQSMKKSIKNILNVSSNNKRRGFVENIVFEVLDFNDETFFKNRNEIHKTALKNRKFLHFR